MRMSWIETLEKDIISGKVDVSDEIKDLLKSGHSFEPFATYLCPTCKEWHVVQSLYILEKTKVSPYGTIREYKVHYLDGKPKREKCGTELEFILNPRAI